MWAIIPLKNLELAKSRLAPSLTPEQRRELMLGMVKDGIRALQGCRAIEKIFLLSRDPSCVQLAKDFGIEILSLAEDRCINSGLQPATSLLQSQACKELLIQHGDLPIVSTTAINEFIQSHHEAASDISLVSCQYRGGTNAMILSLPIDMSYEFGENSFQKHVAQAKQKNLSLNILNTNNLHWILITSMTCCN